MQVLGNWMQRIRAWFGLDVKAATACSAKSRVAETASPARQLPPPLPPFVQSNTEQWTGFAEVVPAVAGFSHRIVKVDHMLAARLASVARLNTPAGRKPLASLSAQPGSPQIPQARIGGKKTRAASQGPRVLRSAAQRKSAQVIQFPVRQQFEAPVTDLAEAA